MDIISMIVVFTPIVLCCLIFALVPSQAKREAKAEAKENMTKDINGKYSTIAAICFSVAVGFSCMIVSKSTYTFRSLDIVYMAILIGFAVTLFLKKKNITFVIVAGANALLSGYYIINNVSLTNSIDFLASAVLAAIAAIICIPEMGTKISTAKKFWFVPAALSLLYHSIYWIQYEYFSYLSISWNIILVDFVSVAAYFFAGMWLCKGVVIVSEPTVQKIDHESSVIENVGVSAYNSKVNGADQLKMYKELLDTGVISQEEFDQKKKKILDL